MPNLNGTGPLGQGSMTGRKSGNCNKSISTQSDKSESQSVENKEIIYGLGRGGRGFRNRFGFGGGRW